MKVQKVTWKEIDEKVDFLYKTIRECFIPKVIVAIGKGGLIPGIMLAHRFGCDFLPIGMKHYKGKSKIYKVEFLYGNADLFNYIHYKLEGNVIDILCVDDIVDSGETINYLLGTYSLPRSNCATLYVNTTHSKFIPRFYAGKTDSWIKFPWEVD